MYSQKRVAIVLGIFGISSISFAMDVPCTPILFIENKSGWALTIIYTTQEGKRIEEPMRQGETLKELVCVKGIQDLLFIRRGQVCGLGASEVSLTNQLAHIREQQSNPNNRGKDPVITIAATTFGWRFDIGWQAAVQGSLVMPEELWAEPGQTGRTRSGSLSTAQIIEQYKDLWRFVAVPDAYKSAIIKYATEQHPHQQVPPLKEALKDPLRARLLVWAAVGAPFGLRLDKDPIASGLWFWNEQDTKPFFKGERVLNDQLGSYTFKDFNRVAGTPREKAVMHQLIDDYKIHLMPIGDLTPTLMKLFEVIKNNPQLQKDIWSIKCNSRYDDAQLKRVVSGSADARPKIVIYPASGKDAAQRVLQTIIAHFKQDPGLSVAPRFNKRITDLIYVAQGNGDDKVGNNLDYFQAPEYVYFNREKVASVLEIDPATLNFELVIPRI